MNHHEKRAKMFVEQNAWMFKTEGMADAAQLIALMIAEAERKGRQQAKAESKPELEWEYQMIHAVGRACSVENLFYDRVAHGWEPFLFSDAMLIIRRKRKETER